MENKTLSATEDTLDQILGNHSNYYRIPPYQRPYAWTTAQVEQLWDDLTSWVEGHSGDVETIDPYFLGSIVLTAGADGVWEVIDGQQRLTTLSILLAAARAITDDRDQQQTLDGMLQGRPDGFKKKQGQPRLSARERDASFWVDRIVRNQHGFAAETTDGLTEEPQKNMVSNAAWVEGKLRALAPAARDRLMEALVTRCFLVVVKTRDTHAAMRIFQVLNDRGLDLRATDILKASILSDLPERDRPKYTELWETAEADLGRQGFETLFSHLRLLIRLERQKETLVKEMEAALKTLRSQKVHFLRDHLEGAIDAYVIIQNRSYESSAGAERVNDHLVALSLLDNQDWEPIALRLVETYKSKAAELGETLSRLEALAYYSLLRRDSVHTRAMRYIEVLKQVASGRSWSSALLLEDDEKVDFVQLLNSDIYSSVRARRPVLLMLNKLVAGGDAGWLEHTEVTVEHVLPQHPPKGSPWWHSFDARAHAHWLNRIGNLVLLSRRRNSAASNRPFDEKKKTYFLRRGTTPYALTSQVVAEPVWDVETVERRQTALLGLLAQRWGLPVTAP